MAADRHGLWFGPRRWGWGWSPVSSEGWVVTVATMLIGVLAARALKRRPIAQFGVFIITMIALVVISMATGTRPGSRLFGDTLDSARLHARSER